jgi:hypothetical protein
VAFSRGASRKAAPLPQGEAIEVAPEMRVAEHAAALRLNHIHLWPVDDGAGRAIIDTGINNQQTKDCESASWR